jgi:hypothetical protein
MIESIFTSSRVNTQDFESLLENASFPLTKSEIIYKAKMAEVPAPLLDLLSTLPSRFYQSKEELISLCIGRGVRYNKLIIVNYSKIAEKS